MAAAGFIYRITYSTRRIIDHIALGRNHEEDWLDDLPVWRSYRLYLIAGKMGVSGS